jgi:hypothetical protein
MFLLDSLMISGIRWTLETVVTAAEAELNDDSVLREQLLDAEMRRELGELTNEEFRTIEADLLGRIREVRERREGGSGPLALSPRTPLETAGTQFDVQASVAGDFHDTEPSAGASAPPVSAPVVAATVVKPSRRAPRQRVSARPASEGSSANRGVRHRTGARRT